MNLDLNRGLKILNIKCIHCFDTNQLWLRTINYDNLLDNYNTYIPHECHHCNNVNKYVADNSLIPPIIKFIEENKHSIETKMPTYNLWTYYSDKKYNIDINGKIDREIAKFKIILSHSFENSGGHPDNIKPFLQKLKTIILKSFNKKQKIIEHIKNEYNTTIIILTLDNVKNLFCCFYPKITLNMNYKIIKLSKFMDNFYLSI
jgi:hypothetical protein